MRTALRASFCSFSITTFLAWAKARAALADRTALQSLVAAAEAAVISGVEEIAERLHPALHMAAAEAAAVISGVEEWAATEAGAGAGTMGLVGIPLYPLLSPSLERAAAES